MIESISLSLVSSSLGPNSERNCLHILAKPHDLKACMRQQSWIPNERDECVKLVFGDPIGMMSDVTEEKAAESLEFAHRVGVLVKPVPSLEERRIQSDSHGWLERMHRVLLEML